MAAIAITLSQADWLKGPAHLFLDVTPPADGAILTLAADSGSGWKTPDAAIYAGCLNELKINGQQEVVTEFCDNQSSPILTLPGTSKWTIDVMLKGILSATLIAKAFGAVTQTITGSTKIQAGSISSFPSMAIAIVFRMANDPTKYGYWLFYSTKQTKLLTADQFKINALSKVPLTFEAEALAGRVAGKDVMEIVHTI
jgi:hypothetical protein